MYRVSGVTGKHSQEGLNSFMLKECCVSAYVESLPCRHGLAVDLPSPLWGEGDMIAHATPTFSTDIACIEKSDWSVCISFLVAFLSSPVQQMKTRMRTQGQEPQRVSP